MISNFFEFECTNNTVKLKALILGFQRAIHLNVAILKAVGDSEIFIQQVRDTLHYVSPHLKGYQKEVWHFISHFQAFNIISVPIMQNVVVDALVNVDASLSLLRDGFSIEILYKPSFHISLTA